MPQRFTTCETIAAIVVHIRELRDGEDPFYSGIREPSRGTLCGEKHAWDNRIPLSRATCRTCIQNLAARTEGS